MNYVIFFPDEMRADSLACYGNKYTSTPNYDKLAKEGVKFNNCFVQNPVCSPSRCCMATGWYPHVNGNRTLWHLLRPTEPSLFAYLKQSGYQVHWYGKNDFYSQDSLAKYVDTFYEGKGDYIGDNCYKQGEDGFFGFMRKPSNCSKQGTADYDCVQKAIEFMDNWKEGDKPFAVFLPLVMPHPPYSAPEPFHDMYSPDQVGELRRKVESGKPSFYDLIPQYRGIKSFDGGFFKKIKSIYLGMCSYVDWLLGLVVEAMDRNNLNGNSTLIATSDHGDFAGDYRLVEKWPSSFNDCLLHVPLIVRTPDCAKGHVVDEQVEMFDILPTILEMSNIQCQHTHFAHSLVEQLHGGKGDEHRVVYAEGGYNHNEQHCFEGYPPRTYPSPEISSVWHAYYPKKLQQQEHNDSVCRGVMMRTKDYKLIVRSSGENELYNLNADANEYDNLYGKADYLDLQRKMEHQLLEWYIATSDVVPYDEDPRGYPSAK